MIFKIFDFFLGSKPPPPEIKKNERYYQERFAAMFPGAQIEVTLDDGTRVDVLHEVGGQKFATEIDFGRKWAEAGFQALWYGMKTGYKPGIGLICKTEKDNEHFDKIFKIIQKYNLPIGLWKI